MSDEPETRMYDVTLVIPVEASNPLDAAMSFKDLTKTEEWVVCVEVNEREQHMIDTETGTTLRIHKLEIPELN